MGTRALLDDERDDLIAVLRDLRDDEWEMESLCTGWRVRDVVAHLLYDELSPLGYARLAVHHRFDTDGINAAGVHHGSRLSPAELVDRYESSGQRITRWWPSLGLADLLVHQQDIRRPLGRTRTIAPERLRQVLAHPDPFARPGRFTRGLRFEATDVDWSSGKGPVVTGPGEALALAMVGRQVALEDLTGDGVPVLRSRAVD